MFKEVERMTINVNELLVNVINMNQIRFILKFLLVKSLMKIRLFNLKSFVNFQVQFSSYLTVVP